MTIDEWKELGDTLQTTSSKFSTLYPALQKIMPDLKGKDVLDAGCGDGYGVMWLRGLGAKIIGIDIAEKNIEACKQRDPIGKYLVMDVRKLALKERFDYVLSSMVLLCFHDKQEMTKAITKMSSYLKKDGRLIITTVHPAFDTINENMESLTRKPLNAYSYAESGLEIKYQHKTKLFSFINFHWRIEDYSDSISEAGLVIERVVEPLPIPGSEKTDKGLYEARRQYPPYIIFVCKKSNFHAS